MVGHRGVKAMLCFWIWENAATWRADHARQNGRRVGGIEGHMPQYRSQDIFLLTARSLVSTFIWYSSIESIDAVL